METKRCSTCQEIKPVALFTKHSKAKDGLQSNCIPCGKLIKKKWRLDNKNKSDEYFANYRSNKEHVHAIQKKNRQKYPEKEKLKTKTYKLNNPHKVSIWQQTRKAKLLNSIHPDHNKKMEEQLHLMRIRLSNCLGLYYHVDHILPLDKGGYHHHLNLQTIPGKLNEIKSTSLEYKHPSLIHWTALPNFLLDRIKLELLEEP